jgi:FtsP/CotA-like multicopper oxidase with cupredoxin domain
MSSKRSVDRRDFLKGAAVTGAAALVPDSVAAAAQAPAPAAPGSAAQRPAAAPTAAREADPAVEADALTTDRPGGDFMVDVLK